LTLALETVPLVTGPDGVLRVGGTRITLDVVIAAFHQGATPEEMGQQYPSLDLGDLYGVIGYYLRRRPEMDEYLRAREEQKDNVRADVEARFEPAGIRQRFLARRRLES